MPSLSCPKFLLSKIAGSQSIPRGTGPDRNTPLQVALRSGAIVVDADDELDVLVSRLSAAKLTSLTIVYAGSKD